MTLEGTLAVTVDDDEPRLAFTVRNAGPDPVDLRFADGCKAEFVVFDGDREVWRFTDGRLFTQALETEALAPGERTTYRATCDPLEGSQYAAVAELRARNRSCTARTTFSVRE